MSLQIDKQENNDADDDIKTKERKNERQRDHTKRIREERDQKRKRIYKRVLVLSSDYNI